MTDDRRLWTRSVDARAAVDARVDRYVMSKTTMPIQGLPGSSPATQSNIELDVLRGSVESHRDLLTPA